MRRVLLLVAGSLAFWLLTSLPFRILAEDRAAGTAAVVYAGTATLLCLVPTSLTLVWGAAALRKAPEEQLVMVLGGTGVRLFGVLLGGFALFKGVPYFQAYPGFWAWLLVCYLFTLALEMALLLAGRPAGALSGGHEPPESS